MSLWLLSFQIVCIKLTTLRLGWLQCATAAGKETAGPEDGILSAICVVMDAKNRQLCMAELHRREDADAKTLAASTDYKLVEGLTPQLMDIDGKLRNVYSVQGPDDSAPIQVVSKEPLASTDLVTDRNGKALVRLVPHGKHEPVHYISMRVKGPPTLSFAKGTREKEDQSLRETAQRELMEEAGLYPAHVRFVKRIELTEAESKNPGNLTKAIFLYELTEEGHEHKYDLKPTDAFESAGARWLSFDGLYRGNQVASVQNGLKLNGVSKWILGLTDIKAYIQSGNRKETFHQAKRLRK